MRHSLERDVVVKAYNDCEISCTMTSRKVEQPKQRTHAHAIDQIDIAINTRNEAHINHRSKHSRQRPSGRTDLIAMVMMMMMMMMMMMLIRMMVTIAAKLVFADSSNATGRGIPGGFQASG